jgi:hypothetical protein
MVGMEYKYIKKDNEDNMQYLLRLVEIKLKEKPEDLEWQDIVDYTGFDCHYDSLRKAFQPAEYGAFAIYEYMKEKILANDFSSDDLIKQLEGKKQELYKERVKTRDAKRELRSSLSAEARLDDYNEVIMESILNIGEIKIKPKEINLNYDGKAILKIGDWHQGKEVDNYFNKYNNEIAKERIAKLIEETVKYCKTFSVGTLYVANLNDMIEGVLRNISRVESNEDLISQIMTVSEMISVFIEELLSYGLNIKYLSVLDNHSRANINYRDHIEMESFVKLIDFYVKARVGNKIEYIDNKISDNVGHLEIDGKNHFFVHGHLKAHAINSVIQNLAMPLKITVDAVHMGHFHKSFKSEFHYAKLYINGSLCGVDDYAMNNGWHSKASQGLLILDGSENDIHIDINLN